MHNILHTTYNVKSWSLNNICTCKKYQKGKFNKSTKQLITTKCETISNSFWDFNLFCIIIKTTIQVYDFKTTNIALGKRSCYMLIIFDWGSTRNMWFITQARDTLCHQSINDLNLICLPVLRNFQLNSVASEPIQLNIW